MIDYRLVALGALIPVAEGLLGHPSVIHTVFGAAASLTLVVLATQKRRLLRRRLLGLPIGVLFHLVLDGSWTRASLFWWPAFGLDFGSRQIPEFEHSILATLGLEGVSLAAGLWAWRRYDLGQSENRRLLVRTGQLSRSVMPV